MSTKAIVMLAGFFPSKAPASWQWQRELYVSFNKAFQNKQTIKKVTYYKVTWIELSKTFLPGGFCFLSPSGGVLLSVKNQQLLISYSSHTTLYYPSLLIMPWSETLLILSEDAFGRFSKTSSTNINYGSWEEYHCLLHLTYWSFARTNQDINSFRIKL